MKSPKHPPEGQIRSSMWVLRISRSFLFLLFLVSLAFAQDLKYCELPVKDGDFSKTYTYGQVQLVKLYVERCNRSIDEQLKKLKSRYANLSSAATSLADFKRIPTVVEQLVSLKQERDRRTESLRKELKSTKIRSVYVVLIDAPLSYNTRLKSLASKIISNTASKETASLIETWG